MTEVQQYPTIVLAGSDPAWMFDMQQHLRAIVGWDYDLLLTFSAIQAMRYIVERQVYLLITEAIFMRHAEGTGIDLARRAREHSADLQVLLIHDDGGAPDSPHVTCALGRTAPPEETHAALSAILSPGGGQLSSQL